MDKLKELMLARFIPQRTAIGLVLMALTQGAQVVLGSDLCTAAAGTNALCTGATHIVNVLAPWLLIMGVADQKRGNA